MSRHQPTILQLVLDGFRRFAIRFNDAGLRENYSQRQRRNEYHEGIFLNRRLPRTRKTPIKVHEKRHALTDFFCVIPESGDLPEYRERPGRSQKPKDGSHLRRHRRPLLVVR